MTEKLAVSRSGHDKGRTFVVVEENEEYVWLADGVLRLLEKPKKKNKKHIQIINHLPEAVEHILNGNVPIGNLEIKRAIKLYCKQEENGCQKQM